MTLTVFPPATSLTPTPTPSTKSPLSPSSNNTAANDAEITLLTITRLFARLEHNLLTSTADLKPLVRDEFQRMRVKANIDYARGALNTLEKSLPGVKRVDRRYEIQAEVGRKRQTLRVLEGALEEVTAQAEAEMDREEDVDDYDGEGELVDIGDDGDGVYESALKETATEDAQASSPPTMKEETNRDDSTTSHPPTSTLRNRNPQHQQPTATSTAYQAHDKPQPTSAPAQTQSTEQSLSTSRFEHESLTESLLSLATQLKSSSTSFHTSLEAEKSVLDRAVDGLDTTTTNMSAAEKRMGMLRKMTEGKGWWGRTMLYAWILGLWVVAILIVFLGPKLRF